MNKVQEAGDELFALFEGIVPPPARRRGKSGAHRSDLQHVGNSLDRFYKEARSLSARYRLGLISRARLVRHFQGRLIEAGYEIELVHRVVISLILSALIGRGG